MKVLRNIRFPVQEQDGLVQAVALKLCIPGSEVRIERILRKALDTRKKNQPIYDYTVLLDMDSSINHQDLSPYTELLPERYEPITLHDPNPFIIGMGPAGLFCALALVEQGFKPWLFDRGDCISERSRRVDHFWQTGELDEDSNVQFGEGGAGAFSDGKLTSRTRDHAINKVYEIFCRYGASPNILYDAYPHLGTDVIRSLILKIRRYLLDQGCQFFYRHKLTDIHINGNQISHIIINQERYSPPAIFLATGNSARGLWIKLHNSGVLLEAKPFAVGFRIEHRQEYLNRQIYGSDRWADMLGAASYRLTDKSSGSFTFCMCPGGEVIAAASAQGGCLTNGMSYSGREGQFGNSAIVTMTANRVIGNGVFAGVEFQQQIEETSYNKGFTAFAQAAADYLKQVVTTKSLTSTYQPSVCSGDLNRLFPRFINEALKSALQKYDQIYRGFIVEGTVVAPETRTSSPIRIVRDGVSTASVSCRNLYPIGEGSGYSGGIISSAADGYRTGIRFSPVRD